MLDGAPSEQRVSTDARPRARRAWTPLVRTLAATGDQWTLLIALALAPGRKRLTHLSEQLPGVSAGVLERYVQQMAALGLVTRTRFKEMPPRVEIELTDAGRGLVPVAGALARWGMRYAWSRPHEHERVELGALLRLLPVLLEQQVEPSDGLVEAVVADADSPAHCAYRVQRGCVRLDEGAQDIVTARIEGSIRAWIAALGPDGDFEQLRFTGDERLARGLLDAVHR